MDLGGALLGSIYIAPSQSLLLGIMVFLQDAAGVSRIVALLAVFKG